MGCSASSQVNFLPEDGKPPLKSLKSKTRRKPRPRTLRILPRCQLTLSDDSSASCGEDVFDNNNVDLSEKKQIDNYEEITKDVEVLPLENTVGIFFEEFDNELEQPSQEGHKTSANISEISTGFPLGVVLSSTTVRDIDLNGEFDSKGSSERSQSPTENTNNFGIEGVCDLPSFLINTPENTNSQCTDQGDGHSLSHSPKELHFETLSYCGTSAVCEPDVSSTNFSRPDIICVSESEKIRTENRNENENTMFTEKGNDLCLKDKKHSNESGDDMEKKIELTAAVNKDDQPRITPENVQTDNADYTSLGNNGASSGLPLPTTFLPQNERDGKVLGSDKNNNKFKKNVGKTVEGKENEKKMKSAKWKKKSTKHSPVVDMDSEQKSSVESTDSNSLTKKSSLFNMSKLKVSLKAFSNSKNVSATTPSADEDALNGNINEMSLPELYDSLVLSDVAVHVHQDFFNDFGDDMDDDADFVSV